MFDKQRLEKAIKELQNGSEAAFDIIYEQTNRLVFYTIYSIIKDYSKAQDIMQSTYLKVYENCLSYTFESSVKAWIIQIARNLAINEYNKKQRVVLTDESTLANIAEVVEHEETPLIDFAQAHLSSEDFLIVMLCVTEGYKRREVAELLNLSTSGVTYKLNTALDYLKSLLEGSGTNEQEGSN